MGALPSILARASVAVAAGVVPKRLRRLDGRMRLGDIPGGGRGDKGADSLQCGQGGPRGMSASRDRR